MGKYMLVIGLILATLTANFSINVNAKVKTKVKEYVYFAGKHHLKDSKILVSLDCKCDMTKIFKDVTELCNSSGVVVKCKVVSQESYIKEGSSIYTDYKLEIIEVYKGNKIPKIIHLESIGGAVTGKEYLEQVEKKDSLIGENEFEKTELDNKIVEMNVNGISPLKSNEKYIIFANYNDHLKKYNPIGAYQGVFEETTKDRYVRNLGEGDVDEEKNIVYELDKKDVLDECDK